MEQISIRSLFMPRPMIDFNTASKYESDVVAMKLCLLPKFNINRKYIKFSRVALYVVFLFDVAMLWGKYLKRAILLWEYIEY